MDDIIKGLNDGLSRRALLKRLGGGALAYPLLSSAGLLASLTTAKAQDVETLEITPSLVEAAQKEGQVFLRYSSPTNVYTHHAEMFREDYGIELVSDRKVGPVGQQVFAQEERAGRHIMDVVETGDAAGLLELDAEGLYLHYTFPNIEEKFPAGFYLPNVGYCPFKNSMLIAYNPDVLPHADAKAIFSTWEGALDPSMRGLVGITDPMKVAVSFGLNLMWYNLDNYGMDFIERLGQSGVRVYAGSALAREDLAAGGLSAFAAGWEGAEMESFEAGSRVAWTYADRHPDYPNLYMGVSKNAPHPNAARLFAAWLFTERGVEAFARSQNLSTVIGMPDMRSAVAKLQQTDWWQPYPSEKGWVPDVNQWVSEFSTLAPAFTAALNGQ